MTSDPRVLWVTGAGSGMGRASAVAAARGRRVVLSGRRVDALQETARMVQAAGGEPLVVPMGVGEAETVLQAADAITTEWGGVDDLMLSAGLNSPRRTWADQTMDEVQTVVTTNLTATILTINSVLGSMRARGGGQVVVVSSYSAWRFTPYAGVAYSASKTALAAVCQTLNAQEAVHGIRACHLCPGDVDSEFLHLRPEVPDAAARALMLRPEDIGRAVKFVLASPPHVRIDELVLTPISQA